MRFKFNLCRRFIAEDVLNENDSLLPKEFLRSILAAVCELFMHTNTHTYIYIMPNGVRCGVDRAIFGVKGE